MADNFTWIGFYTAFANRLLDFREDRQDLIRRILEVYAEIGVNLAKLDATMPPSDIDPFTVFGLFNKSMTDANRRKIISGLAGDLGVDAEQPVDFSGIPVLNPLAATFYRQNDRGPHDIDNLWELFISAIELDARRDDTTRRVFCEAFDRVRQQKGVKWNVTMALFWIRPDMFLNLDSRNRWYLCQQGVMPNDISSEVSKLKDLPSGEAYLSLCDRVRAVLATDACSYATLAELSNGAWEVSEEVNKQATWFPKREDYDPGIDSETWSELMADDDVFGMSGRTVIARLLDYGGAATCTQLAKKYGENPNFYNGGSIGLAKRVQKATNCDVFVENGNTRWWTILYVGRQAGKGEDGSYVWKLRDELAKAAKVEDFSDVTIRADATSALGDDDVDAVRYWLYAPGEKASMWDDFHGRGMMGIGWDELGDLSGYTTKEEIRLRLVEEHGGNSSQKNSAHACWQFSHELKEGDIVYAKRGMNNIIGRGVVEGPYEYDPDGGEYPNLRSVRWTNAGNWKMSAKFAMKTLTDMTDYKDWIAEVEAFFESEDDETEEPEPVRTYTPYSREDFLDDVYLGADAYDALVGLLRTKKNVILQGPPGVGKTYLAKRLAYSMMGVKDSSRVTMVQFHQSYSYEDFIMGYRPAGEGFKLGHGAFYSFCREAAEDLDRDYFFIIDEINRGNLSKIFGELFMLLEADKRGDRHKLRLLYADELFHIPQNVYLIGMMNTADRSLAMMDYALRRRFGFFDLRPGFTSDGFRSYQAGLASERFNRLVRTVVDLNRQIADDESLGDGFCVGHSFLCNLQPSEADRRLSAIVEYELVPLLREYWFDDALKARDWADKLRTAIK